MYIHTYISAPRNLEKAVRKVEDRCLPVSGQHITHQKSQKLHSIGKNATGKPLDSSSNNPLDK